MEFRRILDWEESWLLVYVGLSTTPRFRTLLKSNCGGSELLRSELLLRRGRRTARTLLKLWLVLCPLRPRRFGVSVDIKGQPADVAAVAAEAAVAKQSSLVIVIDAVDCMGLVPVLVKDEVVAVSESDSG